MSGSEVLTLVQYAGGDVPCHCKGGRVGGEQGGASAGESAVSTRQPAAALTQPSVATSRVRIWVALHPACLTHTVVALLLPVVCPLQALRNTVPVPRHWSQKRKYLQGKRGIEKPPFKLPEFIEATGGDTEHVMQSLGAVAAAGLSQRHSAMVVVGHCMPLGSCTHVLHTTQ